MGAIVGDMKESRIAATEEGPVATATNAVELKRVQGMRCPICDGREWYDKGVVSGVQGWPSLRVCASDGCGGIFYDVREEDEAKLLEFYRSDYRTAPNHRNLLTTTTKQNYIMRALSPILKAAEKAGKQLVCGDWGCATGYIPAALRQRGHRATGSEYTRGYRRFAEHFYGVAVAEELPEKHPYDLITCYHVLEHMVAPDVKLKKMVSLLKDDGRLLIATPEWLSDLEVQSGEELSGRGHYYHKNHINCFTRESLVRLFLKAGLVIVSEDHDVYGQTYILRKSTGETVAIPEENPLEVSAKVDASLAAIDAYMKGETRRAMELWPRFPEAYIRTVFGMYGKDPVAQEHFFQEGLKLMPTNVRLLMTFAGWLFQRERFGEAEQLYRQLMGVRPGVEPLMKLGWCAIHRGANAEAVALFMKAADLNPQVWTEAMELACRSASALPHWEERAREEAAKLFAKQAEGIKVEPKDAGFDESKGAA